MVNLVETFYGLIAKILVTIFCTFILYKKGSTKILKFLNVIMILVILNNLIAIILIMSLT